MKGSDDECLGTVRKFALSWYVLIVLGCREHTLKFVSVLDQRTRQDATEKLEAVARDNFVGGIALFVGLLSEYRFHSLDTSSLYRRNSSTRIPPLTLGVLLVSP